MDSLASSHLELVDKAEDDTEEVKEEVQSVTDRFENLKKDVDEKLKKKLPVVELVEGIRAIQAKQANLCGDVGRVLDFMEPVGDDLEKAKVQAEQIQVILYIKDGSFALGFIVFTSS